MKKVKQIIVVRKDLIDREEEKMTCGKLAAQVAHASMAPILKALRGGTPYNLVTPSETDYKIFLNLKKDTPMKDWLEGKFTKIVLYVKREKDLIELHKKLTEAKISACLITDAGDTIFSEPTTTCMGIEPLYAEDIDPFTKRLRMLK
jgi:PTH2 family peptidyl-tRNA hydrolase